VIWGGTDEGIFLTLAWDLRSDTQATQPTQLETFRFNRKKTQGGKFTCIKSPPSRSECISASISDPFILNL